MSSFIASILFLLDEFSSSLLQFLCLAAKLDGTGKIWETFQEYELNEQLKISIQLVWGSSHEQWMVNPWLMISSGTKN
jgi:hypothetical protein